MSARRNIAIKLACFAVVLVGTALTAIWRRLLPAPDQKLEVSPHTIDKLLEFRLRPKHVDMPSTIYYGMKPESGRLLAEEQLNSLIDRLQSGLPSRPSKKFVLTEFCEDDG
jgi:hypothetical protein